MTLEIVRRIRGNVHGTIDVSELENAVINHEYVQRLRRIRQLAFLHYVFPGATHSRFEHSLGVMQLAGTAWSRLKVNQLRLSESVAKISNFAAIEKVEGCHGLLSPTFTAMTQVFDSDYNLQVLRLAGLLHDLGHPPFSHSGERFLPTWTQVRDANPESADYLKEWLSDSMDRLADKGKDPSKVHVRHEVYSLLLVEKVIAETYRLNKGLKVEIDPRDVISVIAPEISPASNSPLLANGIFRTLNELISGELDIDRMDYLLRDSRECGVVYGIFDAGRILDGLCLYQNHEDKSLHVAISYSGLAAFEDYLRARQSMYLQVYFHKTSSSAEAMMQYLSKVGGGWQLPANADKFAEFDEYNIGHALKIDAAGALKDMYEQESFNSTLKDLLYRRRLWKRVYEFFGGSDDHIGKEKFEMIRDVVAKTGVEFQQVSSLNSLTRFQPRGNRKRSQNYLRLIHKDELGVPRVMPIEDYASIISNNQSVLIKRLYVPAGSDSSGVSYYDAVRGEIIKALHR